MRETGRIHGCGRMRPVGDSSLDSISRPVRQWDFHDFDLIIGMDDQNITDLKRMAPESGIRR